MFFQGKTVAFHTLGCKLNFAESSALARLMTEKGFCKTPFTEKADVYVINTCSVTEHADRECRSVVRGALSQNPEAFVAVVGCYAQLKPGEIASIPGVDVVLGANEKFRLLDYIRLSGKNTHAEVHHCDISETRAFETSYSSGDRTRAFLKVQDGCDYSCTFCTIPLARGTSRSDSVSGVAENARKLAAEGIREIVLTGVNIGDFGYGTFPGAKKARREDFLQLIQHLDTLDGVDRFRISSIEPNLLRDEIISFVAGSRKFAPHFHMPLQSGSNKILALMKRRYRRELYENKVQVIRSLMPHCCIGVDVITGFPGETEEDFLETYRFLNNLPVSYFHVFTYSERANTEALGLPGSVPVNERKRRNKMLRILSAKKLRAFYDDQRGTSRTVLFENENRDGSIFGYSDNYVRVKTSFKEMLCNSLQQTTIGEIDADGVAIASPDAVPVQVGL